MNTIIKVIFPWMLVFAMAFLVLMPPTGDAMEITQYDQMSGVDQARYVTTLFEEAALLLLDKGDEIGVQKVDDLLSEKSPDGAMSKGRHEVIGVINGLRDIKNPKKPPHVEHAMIIALNRHGINLRPHMDEFMLVAKDFKESDKQFVDKPEEGKGKDVTPRPSTKPESKGKGRLHF